MDKPIQKMNLIVRGERSLIHIPRSRLRRRAFKSKTIWSSFLFALADISEVGMLTKGPHRTEKRRPATLTLCLDPIAVLAIGSASPSALSPLAGLGVADKR